MITQSRYERRGWEEEARGWQECVVREESEPRGRGSLTVPRKRSLEKKEKV